MWCSLINSCVKAGLGSEKLEWTGLCSPFPHRLSLTHLDFRAIHSSSQPSLCSQLPMPDISVLELNLVSHDDRVCGKKFVKSENCLLGPKGGTVWVEKKKLFMWKCSDSAEQNSTILAHV